MTEFKKNWQFLGSGPWVCQMRGPGHRARHLRWEVCKSLSSPIILIPIVNHHCVSHLQHDERYPPDNVDWNPRAQPPCSSNGPNGHRQGTRLVLFIISLIITFLINVFNGLPDLDNYMIWNFHWNLSSNLVDCPTQLICTWIFICCVP